jgi:hypothetical protein
MKISILISTTLVMLFLFESIAWAQTDILKPGDKIRVTIINNSKAFEPTSKITGIITEHSEDSLQISHHDSTYILSMISVQKLEVSTGQRRRGGRGAAIGAMTGGIISGLISMSSDYECSSDSSDWCIDLFSPGESFLIGFAGGAFLGVILGGIIGHNIKTDRWKLVQLNLSPVTNPNGKQSGKFNLKINF